MVITSVKTAELGFLREGDRINVYGAWPRHEERLPAVIIVPDVRGLTDHFREIAQRFAGEGFFALAIDLYSREGAPHLPDVETAFTWMRQLDDRRVLDDIDGAVRFLGIRPEVRARSIGITGFCMGGQYALMAASDKRIDEHGETRVPNLAACVSFYGMLRYVQKTERKPESPLEMAPRLVCPYLGLFGEDDALIPRADYKELEGILRRNGKTFQTKVYAGAGHAFFNDARPEAYRPDAARDAWARTLAFFRNHLGA